MKSVLTFVKATYWVPVGKQKHVYLNLKFQAFSSVICPSFKGGLPDFETLPSTSEYSVILCVNLKLFMACFYKTIIN